MAIDLAELEFNALEAIQSVDPSTVARTTTLGTALDFTPAIPVVNRVVNFFRQIPRDQVQELPAAQQKQVSDYAESCLRTIQNMMQFDPSRASNAPQERQDLINQLAAQYGDAFSSLGTVVAYLASSRVDSSKAQLAIQSVLAGAHEELEALKAIKATTEAESVRMLAEVRKVAAEAGVSQQATYFGDQAGKDAIAANTWQTRTYGTAAALGGFALLTWTLGFYVEPANTYQAVQFGISKVLIFSTIAFLLFLSARTLMAHRHNEVVNRHRQNALLTFNALADAAATEQTREVVLTHASQCIYAPQESGFTKPGALQAASPSLIELVPRMMGTGQHAGSVS